MINSSYIRIILSNRIITTSILLKNIGYSKTFSNDSYKIQHIKLKSKKELFDWRMV